MTVSSLACNISRERRREGIDGYRLFGRCMNWEKSSKPKTHTFAGYYCVCSPPQLSCSPMDDCDDAQFISPNDVSRVCDAGRRVLFMPEFCAPAVLEALRDKNVVPSSQVRVSATIEIRACTSDSQLSWTLWTSASVSVHARVERWWARTISEFVHAQDVRHRSCSFYFPVVVMRFAQQQPMQAE